MPTGVEGHSYVEDMVKWISRLLENVLGNLVASVVISLVIGAWALVRDLPGPVVAVLMLSAFVPEN